MYFIVKNFPKFIISLILILVSCHYSFAQKKAEVYVLSTLHQFHKTNKNYSFEKLSQIIERIEPDILAVELTPQDLKDQKEQKTKQEYQNSVFPLIKKHKYKTVPLEPAEPKFSELIGLLRESNKENQENFPQKVKDFSVYSDSLYEFLFDYWDSPEAVNSGKTDALFEVKHKFQNSLFGEKEAKVWNDWNTHFLEQIITAAEQNKGKRILVLVGVEHSYWLRKNLRKNKDVYYREIEMKLK